MIGHAMKTILKFLSLLAFAVLSACGGGGGGGGVAGTSSGITTDADGRVGNIPKALVIIPSNAQTQ